MIRRSLAVVMMSVFAIALAGPAAATDRAEDLPFLVRPSSGSHTSVHGDYFLIDAAPGTIVRQAVELRNDASQQIELHLDAVDAATAALGGVSFALAQDPVSATGSWITLDRTAVVLRPGASARVGFDVHIDPDARSGEYLAGLAVQAVSDRTADGATPDSDGGATVVVHTRRVVAVQINVPGPRESRLVINTVRPVATPQGLSLGIEIENTGNTLTRGQGTITVPVDSFEEDFTLDTFVPGTTIRYPIKWDAEPTNGTYDVTVRLAYDGGTAAWSGDVVVGEEVLDELADRQVDPSPSSGGWPTSALWAALALAVTVTATIVLFRARARARSNRPSSAVDGRRAGAARHRL